MRRFSVPLLLVPPMLALLGTGLVLAQSSFPVTILIKEGDTIPGVGVVTSIDNVAINSAGTWIVQVDTNADASSDSLLVRSGLIYFRENDPLPLPTGASISSFDAVSIDPGGTFSGNIFLRGMPTNADSGVYLGNGLIIHESQISTAPEFSANTPYIGFFDAKVNAQGEIMIVASVDDPIIASTVDRALVAAKTSGGVLTSETVLAKEGDILPGQTELVADFGTGTHQTAFNANGQIFYFADLTGLSTTDGVIYRDLELIAQEGSASPVAGRNYETLSSRALDMNRYGQIVFKANLDGDASNDELLLAGGETLAREGSGIPAVSPYLFTAFGSTTGPIHIDDLGNILWYGDWDNPATNKDTGFFLNDMLILQEGAPIGGPLLTAIANVEDAFAMSDDGHYIIFEGTLDGTNDAAFLITVAAPPPVPDGGRVPGAQMTGAKNVNGTDIDVAWDVTSCLAAEYNLFYGDLADVSTYTYSGATCGIGTTGVATFTPPPGDAFWIITSENASNIEGAHGFDSTGRARPARAGGLCGVVTQIRSDRCP